MAKWFLKTGSLLILVGALFMGVKRMRWPGRLPGDINWKIGSSRMVVPLGTAALLGLVLTLYLNLTGRRS